MIKLEKLNIIFPQSPDFNYEVNGGGRWSICLVNEDTKIFEENIISFEIVNDNTLREKVLMKEQIMQEFDKLMQKIRDWK